MAKKHPVAVRPAAAANGSETNRSQLIRNYAAANPTATPKQIVESLTADGHDVSSSLVSSVLSRGGSSGKVDVDSIKTAAAFVKANGGKIADAKKAIEAVGTFIDECGSASKATAALDAYEALAAALK